MCEHPRARVLCRPMHRVHLADEKHRNHKTTGEWEGRGEGQVESPCSHSSGVSMAFTVCMMMPNTHPSKHAHVSFLSLHSILLSSLHFPLPPLLPSHHSTSLSSHSLSLSLFSLNSRCSLPCCLVLHSSFSCLLSPFSSSSSSSSSLFLLSHRPANVRSKVQKEIGPSSRPSRSKG